MTSGTVGTLVGFDNPGAHFYRLWTGADGRQVLIDGVLRNSWNNYSGLTVSQLVYSNKVYILLKNNDGGTLLTDEPISFNVRMSPSQALDSNDVLRLQQKLLEKVKGHNFDLGVNLAQSKQVVDMVTGNLSKLTKGMLALKRGNFAAAARALGTSKRNTSLKTTDISGRWLELQYGWLPALSDTYEACKAYESLTKEPRSNVITSSVQRRYSSTEVSGSALTGTFQEFVQKTVRYRMTEKLSIQRQLGLLDPLSVLWEIIPYSFVVDWFVPIGSYLDNLNQIPHLEGEFLTTDYWILKGPTSSVFTGYTNPAGYWHLQSYGFGGAGTPCSRNVMRLTRVASSGLSVPMPKPRFIGAVHGNRVWNAISLAYQAFRR